MSGTIHNPIHGLYTKQAFGKSLHKGEDAWLQQSGLKWEPHIDKQDGSIGYDVFGVFDGHGGKQAANFASKHVLPILQEELAEVDIKSDPTTPEELQKYSQVTDKDKLMWQMQDAMIQHLPTALVSSFKRVQEQFHNHTQIFLLKLHVSNLQVPIVLKVSGSTATVAVIVGWDLLVASVGDSEAYLDTGAEVIQVSDTHRLDDNKAERKRCVDAGFEVCRSTVDGKPVGPQRVWPGGLAMSRTIGDFMAGEVVLPEPEVRRVALPSKGARLIIASDGLWDAMNPKTAVHHVRGMPAGKAAGELVQAALKAKGLRDDITILVIDAMPDDSFRLPPLLAKTSGGHAPSVEDVGSVDWHKPLDEAAAAETCASNTWERRIAAVQVEFGPSGQASSGHSSDTNAEDLQSAQSESAVDSSAFATPFTSPEPLLEEDSADWETVPIKPKREAATSSSASASVSAATSPDSQAEPPKEEVSAGQWEIPHKQTKLGHQPDRSPAVPNGIKALRESQKLRDNPNNNRNNANSEDGQRHPGNKGRGRGRGQSRGRGRGRRYDGPSRHQQDQSQLENGDDSYTSDSNATAHRSSPDGELASSWGAETVFPLSHSPVTPSPLDRAESAGRAPRILTIPRPPRAASITATDSQQQQRQQQARSNRGNGRYRNGRGGRGQQKVQANSVQSGPVYDKADQPSSQNISFGSFGADDFGSAFFADAANPAAGNGPSSDDMYQQRQDHVPRHQSHRGAFRGRGRGRGRGRNQSHGRGRSGHDSTSRQEATQSNP